MSAEPFWPWDDGYDDEPDEDAPRRWWPPVPDDPRPVVLTARQADVLDGLMHGWTNRRIGRELGLGENTIKSHTKDLFRALDARDRCHAAVLAISGAVDITVLARNGNEKKQ